MRSRTATIGAVAIAAAVLLVVWRAIGDGSAHAPTSAAPTATESSPREERGAKLEREVLLAEAAGINTREAEHPSAVEPEAPPPESAPATTSLLARFVQPDLSELQVASGRILLTGSRGEVREVAVVDAKSIFVPRLAPDVYVARVLAPDLEHREQILDLTRPPDASRGRPKDSESVHDERLLLWPAGWIAVVVRTPDGRSFEEIADELGIERKRLLVDAFDVRTRLDPPDEKAWGLQVVPQAAAWHPPRLYQSWSLPGACVGSLQVLEPPPFWVGLAVHGSPLGWEIVHPGDREVVFRLDARSFEDRLATVRMRVLDAPAGAPRSDARVTLKADTSAHRRADQANVRPDPDGRVSLGRIVPGRYELSVESDGALHQELLELEPGESRELGDIVLRTSAAVPIHAVDGQGNPAAGWVEIAPYRRGRNVEELYPPNLHRSLDRDGGFRLPMPSEVSIVRVTLMDPGTGYQTDHHSQNVLLDPDHPPPGPLEFVVGEPTVVLFDAPAATLARIEVQDELGLVVATAESTKKDPPRAELAQGRYVARHLAPAGDLLGEATFDVHEQTLRISLP